MEVTFNPSVPRVLPDLRPAADAAATARQEAPPLALAQGPLARPVSPSQEALVTRSLLGTREVSPAGRIDPEGEPRRADGPPRVLKPWGVPMLPAEERRTGISLDRRPGAAEQAPSGGSVPATSQRPDLTAASAADRDPAGRPSDPEPARGPESPLPSADPPPGTPGLPASDRPAGPAGASGGLGSFGGAAVGTTGIANP